MTTYDTSKKSASREPLQVLELHLDYCGNCFGCSDSPCTATAGNLLKYSEDFSTWWGLAGCTIATDAIIGPVQLTKFTDDTSATNHGLYSPALVTFENGKQYTLSHYCKAGTYSIFAPMVVGSTYSYVNEIDIATGSVGPIMGPGVGVEIDNASAGIEFIEDSLYRIWFTFDWIAATTTTGLARAIFGPSAYYTGTGIDYAYMSGLMLNEGTLQPYTKTTGAAVAANTTGQPCFNTYATCQDRANFNNRGVKFDGTDDYITIADDASLDFGTGDFAIEILCNPTSLANYDKLVSKGPGTGLTEFNAGINASGQAYVLIGDTATVSGAIGTAGDVAAGERSHLVYNFDRSGNAEVFLNGISLGTLDISSISGTIDNSNALEIGNGTANFDGIVYYVRAYNRILSDAEVWTNYKNLNSYSSGGAVLDLPLNEGSGTTATDYSGNGNDGTLTNGPTWVRGAPKIYRFTDNNIDIGTNDYLPLIKKSDTAQSRISPGQGVKVGDLGGVQIQLMDRPHHDRGIDPYVAYRTYNPESQGTFWSKLRARNPYYIGRELWLRSGYVNDPFTWDDFTNRLYRFDGWTGPDTKLVVKLNGIDLMKSLSDDKLKVPEVTTGTLDADMTAASTASFTITGDVSKYQTGAGYITIDSEIIGYTSGSAGATQFTVGGTITRGVAGTTADTHSSGKKVQRCEYFNDTARNLYETLLTTYGSVPSSYIPSTDWDALASVWFVQTYERYVPKPEGMQTLLNELMIETQSYIYWNEETQKFILGAIKPPDPGLTTYDENSGIIAGSAYREELQENVTTDVVVYYDPDTPLSTKDSQYWSSFEYISTAGESLDVRGESKKKEIYAKWINSKNQAAMLAGRHISRYQESDSRIIFELDSKDSSLAVGDNCIINTHAFVDEYGSQKDQTIQIIQRDEIKYGHIYRYRGLLNKFSGRYGRIMASTASSTYSAATQDEKDMGCYIASSGGADFSDSGAAYKMV